jgi:hypothetical protein
MGLVSTCGIGGIFVACLFTFLYNYGLQQERAGRNRTVNDFDWNWEVGAPLPDCTMPVLWRQVLDYGEANACKQADDHCGKFITDRLIELFGEREIDAFQPKHDMQFGLRDTKGREAMSLRDYFRDPQYEGYSVHTMHQLAANESGYRAFWSFLPEGNDMFSRVKETDDWFYFGSQFFFANHIGGGSPMHFALGGNLFVMLGGRKRWLLVDPAYGDEANCTLGDIGVYGGCAPGNLTTRAFKKVDLDAYKRVLQEEYNVPDHALIDVVLEPGDVLLNCPYWAHAIENLDDVTVAYSFRVEFPLPWWSASWFMHASRGLAKGLYTNLWTRDFSLMTTVTAPFQMSHEKGSMDVDPRFSRRSFTDRKDGDQ